LAISLSPSVNVKEIDLTTSIPAVATSIGATVGNYAWGPVLEPTLVSREDELVSTFGLPNDVTYADFFGAANFLAYASNLQVVRVVDAAARNASDNGTATAVIHNLTDFEAKNASATIDGWGSAVVAKYPGTYGNDITVEVADSTTFNNVRLTIGAVTGTAFAVGDTITGATSAATGTLVRIISANQIEVAPISGTFTIEAISSSGTGTSNITAIANWDETSVFDYAPDVNELAVIVKKAGAIQEKFIASTVAGTKDFQGNSIFVDDIIARQSSLIWANAPLLTGADVNGAANVYTLSGGVDSGVPTIGEYEAGWDQFANPETIDINLCIVANGGAAVGKYVTQNVAEVRLDCVAFVSPDKADVVGVSNAAELIAAQRGVGGNLNFSSSYAVIDGNYKYQYDRYNDVYRWVQLNGDVAGLCAHTDYVADPWFSPAGFNRGNIKNVVKLAFNPNKAERDLLFKNNINPIVTFKGQGTVLFGDKTAQTKPSAFDAINVRRLFITLEKAIATAAKYMLFENNTRQTREKFRSMVEPFLRDVKGRQGIYDFAVVADERNNTPQVIDSGEFRGDIYIKPARSIRTISLSFVAVRSGVSFKEVIG